MRVFAAILLIAGIILMGLSTFKFKKEASVPDAGPTGVHREKRYYIGWPMWVGGAAVIAGIALTVKKGKR